VGYEEERDRKERGGGGGRVLILEECLLETAGNKVDENGIAALQNGRQIFGSGAPFPTFAVRYAARITFWIWKFNVKYQWDFFPFLADLKKKKFMPLKPFAFCTNLIEWIIILPFIGIIWIEWE